MVEESIQKVKRVYVRRHGRPMHQGRMDALETVFPTVQIPKDILQEDGQLAASEFFDGAAVQKLHFEIGFGNGEHLLYVMRENPHDHFIGAEPYMNGMSAFIKSLPVPTPDNIRVHADDALMVLNSLQDASVDVIYILNPDPWPKSRHHKRRIVSEANLDVYARVLKEGGLMVQTTDVDDLAEWMLTKTINSPYFDWTAEHPADWKTAPNGWMSTRYENKGKEAGRSQTYLLYRRNATAVVAKTSVPAVEMPKIRIY
ncbi:MAG TPA: tRNA (guanosine(46)-N7)-methyltransferase TrmB [Rhodospirillaceae bacterium]|nr:tRNA (guanosine(46)-N7)-methyltransferase TrmB [Rhodospirillaceae bacterium]